MADEEAREVTYEVIDLLAHEYGYTIEYIQKLDLQEINGMLSAIFKRKSSEHKLLVYLIRAAFSENSIDTIVSDDYKNLNKLIDLGIAKEDSGDKE